MRSCSLVAMVIVSIIATMFGCSSDEDQTRPLHHKPVTELSVSAAASLSDSLSEIGRAFEKEHKGIRLSFNFAASGTLQKQIEQGAPVDVFISAGAKQMEQLVYLRLIDVNWKSSFLSNVLVIIVPKSSPLTIRSAKDLLQPQLKKLAIGQPEIVPAGAYAKDWLDGEKLWDKLKGSGSIIHAKDVRQVLSYVETANVDAGIVYATDAKRSDKVTIAMIADRADSPPIQYPFGVCLESKHMEDARAFYQYLTGEQAKAIFTKYGFIVRES